MKDFLIRMVTAGSGISSKRVVGSICYIILTLSIILLIFIKPDFAELSEIVNTLIITTASLLGMTTMEKLSSTILGKNNNVRKDDDSIE